MTRRNLQFSLLIIGINLLASTAGAFEPADSLEEIVVSARRLQSIADQPSAAIGAISADQVRDTVVYRASDVLENVPGLAVTLHSGESKANQYLLRGDNLDHGTDLALSIDGTPLNQPTHAHGQGYAEIRNVIPELIETIHYTKGTSFSEIGDFGAVGSVQITTKNTVEPIVSWGIGEDQFQRLLVTHNTPIASANLVSALELQTLNGPWDVPEHQRLINVFEKLSVGDPDDERSLSFGYFHNQSNNQTDQPLRAIGAELADRFAELDQSDQGDAQRISLNGEWSKRMARTHLLINAYAFDNQLKLFNNFTHFLIDPIHGDQEEQAEHRKSIGANARIDVDLNDAQQLALGLQSRNDAIRVERVPTEDTVPLTPNQTTGFFSVDQVDLHSLGFFAELKTNWTERLRSRVGIREDLYWATDAGTHAATKTDHLVQPKLALSYKLTSDLDWVSTAGIGFHSNDVRASEDTRLLAPQRGVDSGLVGRTEDGRVQWSIIGFYLRSASSTTYDPDVGQDSVGPASSRLGFETSLRYQVNRVAVDLNYSQAHAQFETPYDDGTGHVGTRIPNAPFGVGSLSLHYTPTPTVSATLQLRYLGNFPLTSGGCNDAAVRTDFGAPLTCASGVTDPNPLVGHGYREWNGSLRYAINRSTELKLSLFNILNSTANAMEYYYVDRLPTEAPIGQADVHLHPLEPRTVRLELTKRL